jgi:radical SAM superfamily enzyme YgiQ (UPF0313 family)
MDANHIVRGEGIVGCASASARIPTHPSVIPKLFPACGRTLGVRIPDRKGATAATIIPSVGCPMGCTFCTTPSFFGGKGKFVNFREPAMSSSM